MVTVVALLLGATTYAAVLPKGSASPRSTGTWPGVVVSGHVSGLYPGVSKRMQLRVHNLLNHRVIVRWLVVQVGKPGGSCPARALHGGRYPLLLALPRRATRTISVALRMSAQAPNVCSGARFPLTFLVTSDGSR
jgi:hypothetical protein